MVEPNESNTTPDPQVPRERAIVEASDRARALVDREMPNAPEEVRHETTQLVETVIRKAQAEAEKAGEFARENYLAAVRNAREEIESRQLFDPERIEESFNLLAADAEKNWESLVREVETFGDRLQEAAQAAWEALTAPRDPNGPQ